MKPFGYAGEILSVDLSSGRSRELPTPDYAERFIGDRGIADKLYWDRVPPEAGHSQGPLLALYGRLPEEPTKPRMA